MLPDFFIWIPFHIRSQSVWSRALGSCSYIWRTQLVQSRKKTKVVRLDDSFCRRTFPHKFVGKTSGMQGHFLQSLSITPRGTSLIRKCPPLGPMVVLRGRLFLLSEVPLKEPNPSQDPTRAYACGPTVVLHAGEVRFWGTLVLLIHLAHIFNQIEK